MLLVKKKDKLQITNNMTAVISLSLFFLMFSSSPRIDAATQTSMLATPLPLSSLDIYSLSMSFLRRQALYIVINVFVHKSEFFPHQF